MADAEIAAVVRLVIEAHPQGTDVGPKATLDLLQALDDRFGAFGVQKFKRIFAKAKEMPAPPKAAPAAYADTVAAARREINPSSEFSEQLAVEEHQSEQVTGRGAGYGCGEREVVSQTYENKENWRRDERQEPEVILTRADVSRKFGMVMGVDKAANGGHAVTSIRQGGVLEDWNTKNPSIAIQIGDVIVSVNGRTTFEDMMSEFGSSLSCTLKLTRRDADCKSQGSVTPTLAVDSSEAKKEAAEWEKRKARVTAALIPGLKKIVDSEFGPGAAAKISRVEHMYERIGRNEVYERDGELGPIYAPGYIEGLQPERPWHNTQDYLWSSEFCRQWKAIRTELRNCLPDEELWTAGAYQASNEAYGADWKIMGVFTAGQWRDEKRFKVTTAALRQVKGVKLFEAFFARMPAHTKIAPHSDNLNYILTSHLALELDESGCSFKVGSEERHWKEGELLVVDTSYIHSCVNESARARYVLVFRFWHPGLTKEELRALELSHTILAQASEKR